MESNIEKLTQNIKKLSDVVSECVKLGQYYLKDRDNMDQAAQEFIQAQYIGKHYAEAYYRRGKAYFEIKEYDKAISDFTAAIKEGFGSPAALYARALSYYNKSEPDQAILDWQDILRQYNEHYLATKNILATQKGLFIENNNIPIRTIVLLMCGKKKLPNKAKVKELYTSLRFQKSIEYAKTLTVYSHIFVLSAEHYLLDLEKEINPYDKSIYEMTEREEIEWAENVIHLLNSVSNTDEDKYIFLTDDDYSKCLLTNLSNYELPLIGLPEEKHLSYFSEKLSSKEVSK
jgi:tetratricopeptide (TPR) repeat protein